MPPQILTDNVPTAASVRTATRAASERQTINFVEEGTSTQNITNGVNLGCATVPAVLQMLLSRPPVPFPEHQPHFRRPKEQVLALPASSEGIHVLGTPTRPRVIMEHQFFPEHPSINSTSYAAKQAGWDIAEIPNGSSGLNSGHPCFLRPPRPISEQCAARDQPPDNGFSFGAISAQMRSNFHPGNCKQSENAQVEDASGEQFCNPNMGLEAVLPHWLSNSENLLGKPYPDRLYNNDGNYTGEKVPAELPICSDYSANHIAALDSQPEPPTRHVFKAVAMSKGVKLSLKKYK